MMDEMQGETTYIGRVVLHRGLAMLLAQKTLDLPTVDSALPGREAAIPTASTHFVNGHALKGPYPDETETAVFAMGCFWGVEA
jgi:peptide-methionine (S)-S-oxide reductase